MKLRLLIPIGSMLFALTSTTQAHIRHARPGADVGNGTLNNQTREIPTDVYDYIDMVSSKLTASIMLALDYKKANDYDSARSVVVNSYREALDYGQNFRGDYSPVIVDALETGIKMDEAFFNNCQTDRNCQLKENSMALIFLSSYSQYVVNNVIPLDSNYYIPYYDRCSQLDWPWWRNFMENWATSAKELLGLVVGHGNNPNLPHSLGSDRFEIEVSRVVLESVINHLRMDTFSRDYKFEIREADGILTYVENLITSGLINNPRKQREVVRDLRYVMGQLYSELDNFSIDMGEPNHGNWRPVCRRNTNRNWRQ